MLNPHALILAALIAIPGHAQSPKLPIPDAAEIKLGEASIPKFVEVFGMAASPSPQDKDIEAYLQQIGDKVAAHAQRKMKWTFHLDPDPRFKSAVALPGGQVFVGGGILSLIDREDELAIVLGHEIAHIDLGQVNQRIADEMKERHLTIEQLDQIPADVWGTNYGREKETACDEEGMKLAVGAGYSPYGAVRILDVFRYFFSQDEEAKTKYLPAIVDRLASANALIKKQGWENMTKQTPINFPQ
jgi:beta-barrel assembly-enhancing protease